MLAVLLYHIFEWHLDVIGALDHGAMPLLSWIMIMSPYLPTNYYYHSSSGSTLDHVYILISSLYF